jgi:outer membrane protein assembly factor BamA
VDLRRYFKITARSLIAIRLFGAHSTGNFPNVYYFGGLDTLRGLDFREQIGNTVGYANFEFRFPLIDILQLPIGAFRDIRGQVFLDVGGAALKDQTFRFTEKDEEGKRRLKDGRAAYGFGFQISLLGLQLHWDFAKLWDFRQTLSGLKTSFYIGAQF